jgi:hypothetical protein
MSQDMGSNGCPCLMTSKDNRKRLRISATSFVTGHFLYGENIFT